MCANWEAVSETMDETHEARAPDLTAAGAADALCRTGAARLARGIAAGEVSSAEVVEAHIRRIEQVDGQLNAVVVRQFDLTRREARRRDEQLAAGTVLGPLHGVPITIKECFQVRQTPATMGLSALAGEMAADDGPLVARLRRAGAVVLGKTNVPQLMIFHETVNPVYGRTCNPWDVQRSSGGSSGGEAAVIAAGGSPLGLGSDLGGSIRLPAHFCGISGIKPTSYRLTKRGTRTTLRGMEVVQFQPGPMARRVEDLALLLDVLAGEAADRLEPETAPGRLGDWRRVEVDRLRVGVWDDDAYFPVSPPIRRAVAEAADALRAAGANVEPFEPPDPARAMRVYLGLLSADGGADLKSLLRGSEIQAEVRRLLRLARIPRSIRPPLGALLRLLGQHRLAAAFEATGPRSARGYWQLAREGDDYRQRFLGAMDAGPFDAIIAPPHALPALRRGTAADLLAPACWAFVPNLLGIPAGVVAATRVGPDEESHRRASRDRVDLLARRCEHDSVGLPVGVQVLARHWREDHALAVMAALESHFQQKSDYPWPTE